jgi:glycolate oxidase FAD binding subunit
MVPWETLPRIDAVLHEAGTGDAILGVPPGRSVTPRSADELAAVLRWADAAGLAVLPRGGGTKLGWGNPPRRGDLLLSLAGLDRILDHPWADLTVTVEAGCPFSVLQAALATHGQRLALDPLFPARATVGGLLATNDSGTLRVRYGSLRDLVIGMTLALPDGTLARSGGRVVKNVAGYDLPKLATGAFGTLGVVTQATFRLHPLPRGTAAYSREVGSVPEANRLILALHASPLPYTGLQARVSKGGPVALDVGFEGTPEGLEAQARGLRALSPEFAPTEAGVFGLRQGLFDGRATVLKLSVLPSGIADAVAAISSRGGGLSWSAVLQGTGVGHVGVTGEGVVEFVRSLRSHLEGSGGSLVVLERGDHPGLETWGHPGDEAALMAAVKGQFDPKGTLNPGRFVGGL